MFYDITNYRSEGYYEISEVDESYLFQLHYSSSEDRIDIHKVILLRRGKELLERGFEFDLETIAKQIFAYEDLIFSEIRIEAKVTETLGLTGSECIFKLCDLIQTHSLVLTAYPSYMGGTPVMLARVEDIEDAKAILNDDNLLEPLGFKLDDYSVGVEIIKNIAKLNSRDKLRRMSL